MMTSRHPMPFGAAVLEDGRVRFRLWAPAARKVDLVLEDKGLELPMGGSGGWFELATDRAVPGSLYRYRIDRGALVPDPASRFNPQDVHGPSEVVDPTAFPWHDRDWTGQPWEEAVFYELHMGAFSPEGTFAGAKARLDHLAALGVTALQLMPVGDFPGDRDWGYDGVLPFAPDSAYGRPEDLKDLVQAAHRKGMMVFLDLVINHFGPEGNYLHRYAPEFFSARHATPWGPAIDFSRRPVRDFFMHCALCWLEEYHLDGLRLDAVHAIVDESEPDILTELAHAVQQGPGARRRIHLVLENDHNAARYLRRDGDGRPRWYAAQWNDDFHHAFHALLTGERDGYYVDYDEHPTWHLGRCLAEGFSFQGEPSPYRDHRPRGEPSDHLPPTAFVNFLQTHDQVGNRAFGERLAALAEPHALRAAIAILLLAPSPPLLFMGEEFGATRPFLYFCDFGPDLAAAVTEGRRREFSRFLGFADPADRALIPDPNDPATFEQARLDWRDLEEPAPQEWLGFYRELLGLRRQEIVPRLASLRGEGFTLVGERGLAVRWAFEGGSLALLANLGSEPVGGFERPPGRLLHGAEPEGGRLPPWTVAWFLDEAEAECV